MESKVLKEKMVKRVISSFMMLSVQEERSAHLFSKREIRGDLGESNFNGVNLVRIKLLVT